MEYMALAGGVQMPMLGYGVFRLTDKKQCCRHFLYYLGFVMGFSLLTGILVNVVL